MVTVIQFPKKCPHCGVAMRLVQKMHCSWLECPDEKCPFYVDRARAKDPFPFTYAYTSR